jgi:histone acetyltransferase
MMLLISSKKFGFNMEKILIDPQRWVRCIKDYTGVKLVHCKILDEVDCMNTISFVKQQISILEKKIDKRFYIIPYRKYPEQPSNV